MSMQFLPSNNSLHTRRRGQHIDSESEFSPWTDVEDTASTHKGVQVYQSSSDQETDKEAATPVRAKRSGRRSRRGSHESYQRNDAHDSNLSSMLPIRHASPHRVARELEEESHRPLFARNNTLRSQGQTSLLASALKGKHQHWATAPGEEADMSQPPSSTDDLTSSAEEFSDLGEARLVSPKMTNVSLPMPRSVPVKLSHTGATHSFGTSPRRRRGIRHSGPRSLSPTHTFPSRRRSGVESEPEEGSREPDQTFKELLDATKDFMSLSSAGRAFPSAMPASHSATASTSVPKVEETDSSNEVDVPTSFAGSGLLSDSQTDAASGQGKYQDDSKTQGDAKASGFFGWFSKILEVRIWHALAICTVAFSAGIGLGISSSFRGIRLAFR